MKKSLLLLAICASLITHAQVTDPKTTAAQGASDKANGNISNTVNSGLDKTEGAIKGLFKKKKKDTTPAAASATGTAPAGTPAAGATAGSAQTQTDGPISLKTYSNYDFVPGDKIIFEDDF